MSLTTDQQQLETQGYVVLPNRIPADLLAQLCRAAEPCAGIARIKFGENAQRLQPVGEYADRLDLDPFRRLHESSSIADAISDVCGFKDEVFNPATTGILIEPGESSYAMCRHTDWLFGKAYLDLLLFLAHFLSRRCFLQVNAALYEDQSLWLLPGSHRYVDLVEEAERSQGVRYLPANGDDESHRQRLIMSYFRRLKELGFVQVVLKPGDVLVYRSTLSHAAIYWLLRKRRTLHSFVDDEDGEFAEFRRAQYTAWNAKQGLPWWDRADLARLSVPREGETTTTTC